MSSLISSVASRVINDITLGDSPELQRQENEKDKTFSRTGLYYFELVLGINKGTSYFFPFMVSPKTVRLAEPFTVEPAVTSGSGLYVEENGIVLRRLQMAGHFGFKPRPLQGNIPASAAYNTQVGKDWVRSLPDSVKSAVSGQRHLQYLQDNVIRTYSAFKKNPQYADDTKLILHSIRDDEHWLVAPETFEVAQQSSSPMMYDYTMSFIIKGEDKGHAFDLESPDKSFLDVAKDAARLLQNGVNRVNGALQDLTALVGEVTITANDFVKVIVNAGNVFTNVTNFLNATSTLIEVPFAACLAVAEGIDNLLVTEYALRNFGRFGGYPAVVRERFRALQLSADEAMQRPEQFVTSAQSRLNAFYASQQNSGTDDVVASAPAKFAQYSAVGSGNTPGQASIDAANAVPISGSSTPQYTGTHDYVVTSGDTLVSIATHELGNPSLWTALAEFNGLKPPFLGAQPAFRRTPVSDDSPPTGTIHVGQVLQIPDFSTPPAAIPNLPVLGVKPGEDPDVHLFGRDLQATYVRQGGQTLMDLQIDVAHGSVDLATVSGQDNLRQALQTQVSVEAGTDFLYPSVGIAPVVGTGVAALDTQMQMLRVRQSILQDARIAQVASIRVDNLDPQGIPQGDLVNIALSVIPVSGGAPRHMSIAL